MNTNEDLRARLDDHLRNQRFRTHEEVRYWLDQYRQLAVDAIAALARQEEGREAIETNYGSASGGVGDSRASGSTPQAQGYANGFDSRRSHPAPPSAGEGDAEVARLRQALQDVADPIGYLRREAEAKGERLGGMAYSIANDLHFVKQIASRAIAALAPQAAGVPELVPSWRDRADRSIPDGPDSKWHEGARDGMLQCAAELERALTAAGAAPEGLPFTDAVIDKMQDVMAVHGFTVPVRVISDAFRTTMYAVAPNPDAQHGQEGRDHG